MMNKEETLEDLKAEYRNWVINNSVPNFHWETLIKFKAYIDLSPKQKRWLLDFRRRYYIMAKKRIEDVCAIVLPLPEKRPMMLIIDEGRDKTLEDLK